MGQDRKYATLPDLDEAPDIYETPDLADDTSTLQTSTAARSPSPTGSESSEIDPNSRISRHRLQPTLARTQFRSSRIDAREADFSDRVSSKRRAYRVSSKRGRGGILVDGNEEVEEDWGSEDDEEGLDRRVARLLREAQEVQSEIERRRTETEDTHDAAHEDDEKNEGEDDVAFKFRELNTALEKIRNSQMNAGSAHAKLAKQLARAVPEQKQPTMTEKKETKISQGVTSEPENNASAMAKVAEFDARLASLEKALGVSSLDALEAATSGNNSFAPVLPTLSLLDRQVNLLSSVPSQPHLDAVIQKLQQAQSTPRDAATNGDAAAAVVPSNLTPEDMAKLRSLYSILPTLNSLAPSLPPLLARLRSLRLLHANAASASQTLDEVERRQDEADREIKEWTQGLAKVAEAVKGAEGGMRDNVGAIDAWVKDLEARVKSLE